MIGAADDDDAGFARSGRWRRRGASYGVDRSTMANSQALGSGIENHACAVALHSMYYNFVRLHQTLKVSPAMAAGVTDRLWEMGDVVDMLDAFEAKRKREPKAQFEVDEWKIGFKLTHYQALTSPHPLIDT